MFFDPESGNNYVYHQEENNHENLWLYAFELNSSSNPLVSTSRLIFSRAVQAYDFFSANYLTVLSYDSQDKRADHEYGRSIVCQISLEHAVEKGLKRQLRITRSTKVEEKRWNDINVSIPTNIYFPGPIANPFIDHILPIEDFNPYKIEVSGARKVGSILATNKKTVLLLEMELETPENTAAREEDTPTYVSESE